MRSVSSLVRLLSTIALFASILIPISTLQSANAQTPTTTGSLEIYLARAGDGTLLAGGCFTVVDASGASHAACDDDGDGRVYLYDVPAGNVSIQQSAAPDGYDGGAAGNAEVVAGGLASVILVNSALPEPETPTVVGPTETTTPTSEADDPAPTPSSTDAAPAPTEEPSTPTVSDPLPTETTLAHSSDSAGDDSLQIAEDRTVEIDCLYDPNSNTTDFTVLVSKLDPDAPDEDPELTVVARALDNNLEPVPDVTYNLYDSGSLFLDQPWRRLVAFVTWPDGVEANAAAGCNTSQNETSVVTGAFNENDEPIPNGGRVEFGTGIRDTASLTGATINAGGTATYNLYSNADCSGDPVYSETVTVTDRVIPNSGIYEPTEAGRYNWQVVYSGDELNQSSASVCGDEEVIVGAFEDVGADAHVRAGDETRKLIGQQCVVDLVDTHAQLGQRGAQAVRQLGDELSLVVEHARDPGTEIVERRRQLDDLVRPFGIHTGLEFAVSESTGCARQRNGGADDGLGQAVGDGDRDGNEHDCHQTQGGPGVPFAAAEITVRDEDSHGRQLAARARDRVDDLDPAVGAGDGRCS